MAHGYALPRRGGHSLREGLAGAAGAGVEPARHARASRAHPRRVEGSAYRGVRRAAHAARHRHPARGACLVGGHLQHRDHRRAAVRHHDRARRAARLDRQLLGRAMATSLTQTAEQTRARYPDETGYVERDGVRTFYEVYGDGEPTLLLLPTWSLLHSRHWKMQIPYLARHCRVVTFDGRGNGRSDRPQEEAAYDEREFAADALAVLDATHTERAVIVGFSLGAQRGLLLAAEQPERIEAAVFIGAHFLGGGDPLPE